MASSIVGTLRVLLSADTADFASGLDAASKKTQQFSGQMSGFATEVSAIGRSLAGLLSVGAITAAAAQITNYAGKIADLSAQTGLTTKTIQEMQHAATLTGASLENFTNAAFKLGVNIAGGSNSVVGALRQLGLSYDELRRLSPDEQFNRITTALSHVQSAQERNKLAVELFGRAAKDILPAISQGYDHLTKSATVAGDAQIRALDMAGDALGSFLLGVKNLSVELAGGLIIAVREGLVLFEDWVGIVDSLKKGFDAWGTTLEFVGLKTRELPKVMNETKAAVSNLPEPLRAVNISVEEQERRMKALEAEHKKVSVSTKSLGIAQEEVDPQIQRLTQSFTSQIEAFRRTNTLAASVPESFRLMRAEFANTIPVLQNLTTNGFEPFKATIEQHKTSVRSISETWNTVMGQLPGIIIGAIQGGGSAIGAAGALIGTTLMSKFQQTFGPAIEAALPFGIGKAVTALLPILGSLFGPVAQKIGQFFRDIFGGPSADELRGREAVADFEDQLHGLLNETQRAEAGNEAWKKTVIAIRDAYIAAGKTEAEALAAAEKLWASSRDGAEAAKRAIAEIQAVLNQATRASEQLDASMDETFRDRSFTVTENRDINENLYRHVEDDENRGYGTEPGFAGGTMGRLGNWFGNFGSGMQTVLHGTEAVITPDQAPAFAMDVLSQLAGRGGNEQQAAPPPIVVQNHLNNNILIDGQPMKQWVLDTVVTAIDNNERGVRSSMRDVLGVTT